jgi:hypothetical protein
MIPLARRLPVHGDRRRECHDRDYGQGGNRDPAFSFAFTEGEAKSEFVRTGVLSVIRRVLVQKPTSY